MALKAPHFVVVTSEPGSTVKVPVGKGETVEAARAAYAALVPKLVTRDGWLLEILDCWNDYAAVAA